MKRQLKSYRSRALVLGILAALIFTVTGSFGHEHHDGREKDTCPYDLFLQQYTAVESGDIRLVLPDYLFALIITSEIEFSYFTLYYYGNAYPNAPPFTAES